MASVEENVPVKENSVEEKSTEKTATKPSPQVDYPAFWKIGLALIFFFLSLFIMIVKNMVRSDDFVILFPAIVGGVAILAHIALKLFGKKNTYFYPMLIIFVAIIVLAGFYNGFIMVEDKVDEDGAERSLAARFSLTGRIYVHFAW